MSNEKVRVGVIGVGYVASNNFLPVFPRMDDVELVGIMANHLESAEDMWRSEGSTVSERTGKTGRGLCFCTYSKGMSCRTDFLPVK